jgi:hypothetical protein
MWRSQENMGSDVKIDVKETGFEDKDWIRVT